MFTGLVEEVGEVKNLQRQGDAVRISIAGETVTKGIQVGDSIAVNGVCLTVAELSGAVFVADVMQESLNRSSLGALSNGSRVNLERALLPTTRLGGHIMQGHVDSTVDLLSRSPSENWEVFRFTLPGHLRRYLVEKGSIAVDGTSLTISSLSEQWFEVSLIPTTLRETTLQFFKVGDTVNIEVDVVAKYVENMVLPRGGLSLIHI